MNRQPAVPRQASAMGDDPDFLLLYDLAPLAKRAALLETFFVHPDERRGFQHIVDDPLLRARLEFEFKQTVPFESFHLLVDTGFARPADEFRRRSKLACGRVLPNAVATDRMRDKPPVVPGLWDVHRFLASCARCHRRSAKNPKGPQIPIRNHRCGDTLHPGGAGTLPGRNHRPPPIPRLFDPTV